MIVSDSVFDRATMRVAMRLAGSPEPNRANCIPCVLHDEKTPSLHLIGAKGRESGWKCFGCEAGGGVAEFLVAAGVAADHAHAAKILEEHLHLHLGEGLGVAPRSVPAAPIVAAAGRPKTFATIELLAAHKGLDAAFLRKLGVADIGPERAPELGVVLDGPGVLIPYPSFGGVRIRSRVRQFVETAHPSRWTADGEALGVYASAKTIESARKLGKLVIVEGESDCWTLWAHSIAALGVPGASMAKLIELQHVEGIPCLYVVREPGQGGTTFVEGVATRLRDLGWPGELRVIDLQAVHGCKDPSALHMKNCEQFLERWNAAVEGALPYAPAVTTKKHAAGPLAFTSVGDLMDEPEEITAFIVDGLLPTGGTSMLVAKPKVGKSTTARTLALCVARGEDFLGRKCAQGAVAWLALEEKRSEIARQFKMLGATAEDPIEFFFGQAPADMVDRLRDYLHEKPVALIVVDPLIRLTKSRDLNDYSLVAAELEPITILARESGAHLSLLHHSPKAGDDVLGSTALFASVDTLLVIRKAPGTARRTISSTQRYGVDLEETVIELDAETGFVRAAGTRLDADDRDARRLILEFLNTCSEPVEEQAIRENIEVRRSAGIAALRGLVKDGNVSRDGGGKRGCPYTYATPSLVSGSHSSEKPWEPENQNPEMTEKPRQTEVYSGSRVFDEKTPAGTTFPDPGNHLCRDDDPAEPPVEPAADALKATEPEAVEL